MRKTTAERGVALLGALVTMIVLLLFGAVCFTMVLSEGRAARREKEYLQTLLIAEGGFERALLDLRKDWLQGGAAPSWADGDINGYACGPNAKGFYWLPYFPTTLGEGTYSVTLKNVPGKDDQIWIRSVGTAKGQSAGVEAYVKMEKHTIWSNAIFGGLGNGSTVINGNVDIRGSVHILGEGLTSSDLAIDMNGGASIGNNYDGMPLDLLQKIPPCPQIFFNGMMVDSLGASLRVKRGQVGLSGGSTAGNPDDTANALKETLDGAYVSDGYTGNVGAPAVHADNGRSAPYDLESIMDFPRLTDMYDATHTYLDHLRNNALVISDPVDLAVFSKLTPESSFKYVDPWGRGSISLDGAGNLQIDGIVYIMGDLNTAKSKNLDLINYTGTGSIVVEGDVVVATTFVTPGLASYPQNNIAIMTPKNITFATADTDVCGIFYAENTITCLKQTDIAGALAAPFVDMGAQVPSIFYVPDIQKNLPPGLIGSAPVWRMKVVKWGKFQPEPYGGKYY